MRGNPLCVCWVTEAVKSASASCQGIRTDLCIVFSTNRTSTKPLAKHPAAEIADVIGCSERSVFSIQSNLRHFGSTKAPSNGVGRPRSITPPMLDALCEYLLEKPDLYRDEMVLFLLDEFNTHVTPSRIGRALKSRGWSKKTIHHIAKRWNADLWDLYMHNSWDSGFCLYHYVFMDESGCDKRSEFRWMGWSPLDVTDSNCNFLVLRQLLIFSFSSSSLSSFCFFEFSFLILIMTTIQEESEWNIWWKLSRICKKSFMYIL